MIQRPELIRVFPKRLLLRFDNVYMLVCTDNLEKVKKIEGESEKEKWPFVLSSTPSSVKTTGDRRQQKVRNEARKPLNPTKTPQRVKIHEGAFLADRDVLSVPMRN